MVTTLHWGILGCGHIAGTFAEALPHSETGKLVAVASRDARKAQEFAVRHGADRHHGSYDDVLADAQVDAVYIATPHPMHAEWVIRCAEAKKHILCEKPVTLNAFEAMAVLEHVRRHDVFFMEAFMYRCHPQTRKLVELIEQGAVGEVRHIHATFGFHAPFEPEGRLFSNELGGGAILDVGCYPVSVCRLIAGAALGRSFAEPLDVNGSGRIGRTGVDEQAAATLLFENGITAQVATAVCFHLPGAVEVFGTEGRLEVKSPWTCSGREGGRSSIVVHRNGEAAATHVVETDGWLYGIEADTVAAHLRFRQAAPPAPTWDDTIGNMQALDRWRDAVGVRYEREKPDNLTKTLHGRPLRPRPDHAMTFGTWPGSDRPVARLVMGTGDASDIRNSFVMWDQYVEAGGNAFDTARHYPGMEEQLGRWLKGRGVRQDVFILDKGAHTPDCNPDAVTRQHRESLEALGVDRIDLYVLHRDNLQVPVGEFIDVLNEHLRAGTMSAVGASNWSLQRIDEANDYARSKGAAGFEALSNNFSLAAMIEPPWPGCLSNSDTASRRWLNDRALPLFAWSSLARGFFAADRAAGPEDRRDGELARCWYSEENFERKRRAEQFARERDVTVVDVALAYVLCQHFPTFALIGPHTPRELTTSLAAVDGRLSPREVAWLNLEVSQR